jgi:2-methylcitrate dehydratase
MSMCECLAAYVHRASWDAVSPEAKGKLKQHLLDSLGCALGALPSGAMAAIRSEEQSSTRSGPCSLIGGGSSTPERAAFFNTALIDCLDFNDVYLAGEMQIHPSDNLPALLAGAELSEATGEELMLSLALAFHIQCRIASSGAIVDEPGLKGLPLAISVGAGMSRILRMPEKNTAHAIALCAAESMQSLRRHLRTESETSLGSAFLVFRCVHATLLAKAGLTGDLHIAEELLGTFGKLNVQSPDWEREAYDNVLACSLKRFSGNLYAQSVFEGLVELRELHKINPETVEGIHVDLFREGFEAFRRSSNEGAPRSVRGLSSSMAWAMTHGDAPGPGDDVTDRDTPGLRSLSEKVVCWLSLAYTREFPESLRCKVRIGLQDGEIFEVEKDSYSGFFRTPMSVEALLRKFKTLAGRGRNEQQLQAIIECLAKLEYLPASRLTQLLSEGSATPDTVPLMAEAVRA